MLLRPVNLLGYLAGPMRELGPYALIALVVPGGCLIAFAFWAFRHRAWLTARQKCSGRSHSLWHKADSWNGHSRRVAFLELRLDTARREAAAQCPTRLRTACAAECCSSLPLPGRSSA